MGLSVRMPVLRIDRGGLVHRVSAVRLTSVRERPQLELAQPAFHRWIFPDGSLWALFHRLADGYLLRFPGLADFEISLDGQNVAMWRAPGVQESTAEHLYLNQAVPLALSRQGRLVLHASAVEIKGQCIAFAGPSGRGKSTLAASFATSGHRFLTDDGLQLAVQGGRLEAMPSHPSIRLWADSQRAIMPAGAPSAEPVEYTSKVRFLADASLGYCPDPQPVRALFFLGPGDSDHVRIEPLRPQAALVELVRHSFLLDISEQQMLASHFDEISRTANLGALYHLDYPRRYEMLAEVRHSIIEYVQEAVPS
jgi:hypothetical protein